MNSPKETSLARLPRSGDKLVDWIFKQFVVFLRRETMRIKRKRYVYDKDDPHRQALFGLLLTSGAPENTISIAINTAKRKHRNRDEELSTLIHELSHIMFWETTHDRPIQQVEKILFKKFTQAQKNYLKSFIPRHEVKSI